MLALPPPIPCVFSSITTPARWSTLELGVTTADSTLHFPAPELEYCGYSPTSSSDPKITKKLYHNASERDRRKKINHLYSSLRSMLPEKYHTKKMSIPCTISQVLKYIPELQHQVEKLIKKKEELLLRVSRQEDDIMIQENQRKLGKVGSNLSTVSASRVGNGEFVVQISTTCKESSKVSLSEMLLNLEEEELLLLNASCFEASQGKIFYNLYLQVLEGRCSLDCELLSEKLLSLFDKRKKEDEEIVYDLMN